MPPLNLKPHPKARKLGTPMFFMIGCVLLLMVVTLSLGVYLAPVAPLYPRFAGRTLTFFLLELLFLFLAAASIGVTLTYTRTQQDMGWKHVNKTVLLQSGLKMGLLGLFMYVIFQFSGVLRILFSTPSDSSSDTGTPSTKWNRMKTVFSEAWKRVKSLEDDGRTIRPDIEILAALAMHCNNEPKTYPEDATALSKMKEDNKNNEGWIRTKKLYCRVFHKIPSLVGAVTSFATGPLMKAALGYTLKQNSDALKTTDSNELLHKTQYMLTKTTLMFVSGSCTVIALLLAVAGAIVKDKEFVKDHTMRFVTEIVALFILSGFVSFFMTFYRSQGFSILRMLWLPFLVVVAHVLAQFSGVYRVLFDPLPSAPVPSCPSLPLVVAPPTEASPIVIALPTPTEPPLETPEPVPAEPETPSPVEAVPIESTPPPVEPVPIETTPPPVDPVPTETPIETPPPVLAKTLALALDVETPPPAEPVPMAGAPAAAEPLLIQKKDMAVVILPDLYTSGATPAASVPASVSNGYAPAAFAPASFSVAL